MRSDNDLLLTEFCFKRFSIALPPFPVVAFGHYFYRDDLVEHLATAVDPLAFSWRLYIGGDASKSAGQLVLDLDERGMRDALSAIVGERQQYLD